MYLYGAVPPVAMADAVPTQVATELLALIVTARVAQVLTAVEEESFAFTVNVVFPTQPLLSVMVTE